MPKPMFESNLGIRASGILNDSDVPGKSLKDGLTELKSQIDSVSSSSGGGALVSTDTPGTGENVLGDGFSRIWHNPDSGETYLVVRIGELYKLVELT